MARTWTDGGGRWIRWTLARRGRVAALSIAVVAAIAAAADGAAPSKLDVPYEPTPPAVVDAMLRLANVGAGDVVYDLGCGDGRIVIAAAKRGARGVGIDLDPERVREARANARAAGIADRVEIREGDLFEADFRDATVVMLFLWPEVNLRLRPRLLAQLRRGARIVSHWHDMGDWKPRERITIDGRNVYLWIAPGSGAPP